jgi:hypothetical protein
MAVLAVDTWHSSKIQDRLGDAVLRELHDVSNWPIMTFGSNRNMHNITGNTATKPDVVIIILSEGTLRSEDVLSPMLTSLSSSSSWNSLARYVIVSTAVPATTRDQHMNALTALNISLFSNILDVIFLIAEPVHDDRTHGTLEAPAVDIFTWFPFGSKSTGSSSSNVTYLDRWVETGEGRVGVFRKNADLFPPKPLTNMGGRNVSMAYGLWPPLVMTSDRNANARPDEGLEIRIMKTVAESTNFSLVLWRPKDRVRVHGYFGAQWLNPDLQLPLQGTWPHFSGAFAWFVPTERQIPRWQSLIRIFNPSFWLLVFLVYILGSLTFLALASTRRADRETASFSNKVLIFMNSFSMLLSGSVYKKPKRTQSQLFFVLWSFYCFQINNAYQSSLIGFLTNPGHLPSINDLDDLLESGIELGIQSGFTYYFNDTSDRRNRRILKSHIECDLVTSHMCLDRMAYKGDLAVAAGRKGLEFLSGIKYMKNGKPMYVPLRDNIREGHMVIYMRKGNVLLNRIDSVVLRLQRAGLIDKWFNDIKRKFGKHFDRVPVQNGLCVLSMSHLQGAYSLLLVGVLLGLTTWFLEIIFHSTLHRFNGILI